MNTAPQRPRATIRQRGGRLAMMMAVFAIALTTLVAVPAAAPAQAAVGGDDYPAYLGNAAQDALVDPWNFYNRECTSFVAWRLNNTNGVDNFTNQYGGAELRWGNANTWGTSARAKGFLVDNLPAVGSVAWSTSGAFGHVAWVAAVLGNGKIVIEEYNWRASSLDERGRYNTRTVLASAFTGFIHVKDLASWPPTDGSFIRVNETGEVYRIAGGAPVYVSSWTPFGGSQPFQAVTAAKFATLPAVPQNGTVIRGQATGDVFTIANGAPVHVTSWDNIGGVRSFVGVDDAAITNAGKAGVWRFLRDTPADGFLRGAVSGRIFRVSAGHPYYVPSWEPWGGSQPWADVDDASLDSCDHLDCTAWGYLSSATGGPQSVTVGGWAQDPTTVAPTAIQVYSDGVLLGVGSTSIPRKDVEATYHRGTNYGYSLTFPAPAGLHKICVYAINGKTGTGVSPLGCRNSTIANSIPFTVRPTPTISGTVRVGEVLSAGNVAFTPIASVGYQWKSNGANIAGQVGSSITLTPALAGTRITVTTTAVAPGYTTTSATSASTAPVAALAAFGGVPLLSIKGTARVGQVLTGTSGSWSPSATALAVSWRRDGTPIAGADDGAYLLTAADMGHTIAFSVTASRRGYAGTTATSAGTPLVAGRPLTASPAPKITGTAAVGATLRAAAGVWTPSPVALRYQWHRDGSPIAGATASAFTVGTSDVGTAIAVTVTGSASGYAAVARSSAPTGTVPALAFAASPVPVISGSATVGASLTATVGAWSPSPATYSYQWLRGGARIPGATGNTYAPSAPDVGKKMSVAVTAARTGYRSTIRTSAATAPVAAGSFTRSSSPRVRGEAKVGATLTASAGKWGPTPTAITYQWLRNGVGIAGATRGSYRLVPADAASVVSVRVAVVAPGYARTTMMAPPTVKIRR